MEIVKIKIKDLTPYEKNAKLHPKEHIEQIKMFIGFAIIAICNFFMLLTT